MRGYSAVIMAVAGVEQVDDRSIYGAELSRHWHQQLAGVALEHVVGVQWRYDDIAEVGLYNTQARVRLSTVRQDRIEQGSAALFSQSGIQLSDAWYAHIGLRYDYFAASVTSDTASNSGEESDGISAMPVQTNLAERHSA